MQLGICTSVDNSAIMKEQGWDYVEEGVQGLLAPLMEDADWKGLEKARTSKLPIPAANVLVHGSFKVTGPEASIEKLTGYMTRVLERAGKVGMKTLVFGSGGARNIPDGFDRAVARRQIIDFLKMSAPIAQRNGITLVAEHLNKGECNVLNSVAEAMEYVKEVNHPNFQCLVDSYHFWLENESLDSLKSAMPWIKHVHVAHRDGRFAPTSDAVGSDYSAFFKVLKQGGYDGRISVEGKWEKDIATIGPQVLAYLKKKWKEA